MNDMAIELAREWEQHNQPRHVCYYEESDDAGMANCPAEYETLGEWLEDSGFPVNTLIGLFFGHRLNEPGFWWKNSGSQDSGTESPVSGITVESEGIVGLGPNDRRMPAYPTPESVAERRRQAVADYKGAPVEEEDSLEVRIIKYFDHRFDRIEQMLVALEQNQNSMGEAVAKILLDTNTLNKPKTNYNFGPQ